MFRTAPRRIIVSSFASHVHRIQQVLDAAHHHGRKVAFVGRSMVRNMGIARDLGYLKMPKGLVVDLKVLEKLADDKITLICTGSQGEPMAALSRMANRDHMIRVGKGDTVLLASSLIPGNENAIYRVINSLTRWGANVVHKGNAKVHVSGHASAGELVYCYNIVRPSNVMPVHGEWRHLTANGELAIRTGVPADNVVLAEDGVVVDLVDGQAKVTGKVPAGLVYVDGMTVGGATEASLKDRRTLAEEGFITIVALVDADTGKLTEPPEFLARGFVHDESDLRRRRAADREGAGQGREGGHRRAAPARAADPPHRQPVGPRHLPAQPDHPADHHRRLRYADGAPVSRAAPPRGAGRPGAASSRGTWPGRPRRRAAGPSSTWPSVCAIPQLTPAGCGRSRISAANRRTAASTAARSAVGTSRQNSSPPVRAASAPGNEAQAPSRAWPTDCRRRSPAS